MMSRVVHRLVGTTGKPIGWRFSSASRMVWCRRHGRSRKCRQVIRMPLGLIRWPRRRLAASQASSRAGRSQGRGVLSGGFLWASAEQTARL